MNKDEVVQQWVSITQKIIALVCESNSSKNLFLTQPLSSDDNSIASNISKISKNVLSRSEAAEYIGCSLRFLDDLVLQGEIRTIRFPGSLEKPNKRNGNTAKKRIGKKIGFRVSALDEFLDKNTV